MCVFAIIISSVASCDNVKTMIDSHLNLRCATNCLLLTVNKKTTTNCLGSWFTKIGQKYDLSKILSKSG